MARDKRGLPGCAASGLKLFAQLGGAGPRCGDALNFRAGLATPRARALEEAPRPARWGPPTPGSRGASGGPAPAARPQPALGGAPAARSERPEERWSRGRAGEQAKLVREAPSPGSGHERSVPGA